ncbi:ribosomal RNA processing protein 1 [Apis mellifera caucasica]|nr:ribosomal RNA processing protein 1 [Apis mellifera caucasica]
MAVKKVRYTNAPLQIPMQRMKQIISINEKDKKAIVIAQEIKFARLLSSNDKIIRDRVLKNLRKWLTVRSQSSFTFTEADFMRLWKGLFYCMWMSDKPLIQEELAESLSKIVHCFKTKDVILLYILCTLKTLGIEWFGIDQYRLDKFCMLVRRIIRQTFQKCKENLWNIEWIKDFSEILEKLLVDPQICQGFNMHITEIFLEELSKISNGNVPEDVVTELIKPFISYFISMDDERQIRHIMRHIFRYLIFQSDIGIDYMEKFKAWRDAGFPAGSIDIMEKIELSDDEMDDNITEVKEQFLQNQMNCDVEKSLDPRAGRVDVDLPQIPFNSEKIAILLNKYKFHPSSTTKSRRQLRHLIKEFTELSEVVNNHEQQNDILNKKPIWLMPILTKLKNETNNKSLKEQHKIRTTTNSKKRVKIALQCNTAQHTSEYISQIRKSPAIPFDANKKPLAGVLKASPIPSPINPFYKRNIL